MTEEEERNFPHKNVITRALGMRETVQVDIRSHQIKSGDVYILCSDGLSGMVRRRSDRADRVEREEPRARGRRARRCGEPQRRHRQRHDAAAAVSGGLGVGVKYRVASGKLTVKARSSVHDTTTVWDKVTGDGRRRCRTRSSAANATFAVDMTSFDAGDWLKNRKLRKDFDMDAHPDAQRSARRACRDVVRDGAKFTATAEGVLRWRGKEVVLVARRPWYARSTSASKPPRTFELDIKKLGLRAAVPDVQDGGRGHRRGHRARRAQV